MQLLDVLNSPWVIVGSSYREIREIYATHLRGEKIDIRGIEDRLGRPLANEQKPYQNVDGVAVIAVEGVMAKRMNLFSQISGGVSTQIIERDFLAAMADTQVNSVLLLIDSPGGAVDGTQELAQVIKGQRGKKPIAALGEGIMASGAYWIASAADKIYISSDTTSVGSIGVVATHTDYSEAEAKKGIKVTEITSGKYKKIASEHKPLTGEGQEVIQAMTDHIYSIFVDEVAANRGVSVDRVLAEMADGRLFMGQKAVAAGLVDGVMTFPALVKQLGHAHISGLFGATAQGETHMAEVKEPVTAKTFTEAEVETARAEATALGYAKGATDERVRIQAIEGLALTGHEALIQKLKFDGKTTAADAASQVIAAEQKIGAEKLEKMRAESPKAVAAATEIPTKGAAEVVTIDAQAVGKKAQQYQAEERKKGNEISTTQAVAHVMAEQKAGR